MLTVTSQRLLCSPLSAQWALPRSGCYLTVDDTSQWVLPRSGCAAYPSRRSGRYVAAGVTSQRLLCSPLWAQWRDTLTSTRSDPSSMLAVLEPMWRIKVWKVFTNMPAWRRKQCRTQSVTPGQSHTVTHP
eukprot:1192055-Prorocentrum_minimum.AAC.1